MTEQPQRGPGRPRVYESDADRVRAYRARKRAEAEAAAWELPADDPAAAATALADVLPLLRAEAKGAAEGLSKIAERIEAATTVLSDASALDAQMRRAETEIAKERAEAASTVADMRRQLDTAVDDRANADAAAGAAEQEAAAARETLDRITVEHQAAVAELTEACRSRDQQIADMTSKLDTVTQERDTAVAHAEKAATTAADTIRRLDATITAERDAARDERQRADAARDELATVRIELAEVRAREEALRTQVSEQGC